MTSYPRSAYKNPFGAVQPNGASSRGWGSGWPHCQPGKQKTVSGGGIRVTVRAEIAELVGNLLVATDKLYNLDGNYTGGYNCRPIANTSTPSNHSWGLAIDINYNKNPRTASTANFHSEIPPAVVAMWNDCGFFWGGFYNHSSDTMHFEFIGTPASVAGYLAKAKKYNTGQSPAPSPKPTPAPVPVPPAPAGLAVSVAVVLKASLADPKSTTGVPTAGAKEMVKVVEDALVAEKLLDAKYADGLFGSKTVEAYKKYQLKIGLKGSDADGTPGLFSLTKLGAAHKFTVIH